MLVVCPGNVGSSTNATICSLPSGQLNDAAVEYQVPSTVKLAPAGLVEIVIVLVTCASKHIPPKVRSNNKEKRFIDSTTHHIGLITGGL
jgi:hypothetical protein